MSDATEIHADPPGFQTIGRFKMWLANSGFQEMPDHRWLRSDLRVDIGYQNQEWTITIRPAVGQVTAMNSHLFRYLPNIHSDLPEGAWNLTGPRVA